MTTRNIIKEYFQLRDKIIEKEFSYLDGEQRKAVLDNNCNTLVSACPGSGKTTVLVNKVLYLVKYGSIYKSSFYPCNLNEEVLKLLRLFLYKGESAVLSKDLLAISSIFKEKAVKAENIIVITFTKAAAENMKNRFLKLSKGETSPFFGTFHGLFYKLLLMNKEHVKIIEASESFRIISNTLTKYTDEISEEKVKEIRNYISMFKVNNMTLEEFNLDTDSTVFINCFRDYEAYKKQHKLMDFDDLQIYFKGMLKSRPRLLDYYRKNFKYILVDEFQDCDSIQLDVLKMLNSYNSIFAVGDEDQCIYTFRGSRPDFMVKFHTLFNNGRNLFLYNNYRSTENIVDTANKLIKYNIQRNIKNMVSVSTERKKIEIYNYLNENLQGNAVALNIENLKLNDNCSFKDFAVLYRTNMESRSIIDSFIRRKLPFKLLDKEYNFFQHFICRDIISYLKLSIMTQDAESFVRLINKPFRYRNKIIHEKLLNSQVKEYAFELLKNLEETPIFQMKNLDKLYKEIAHLNKMSLQGAIAFILTNLGYEDYLKTYSKKYKIKFSDLLDITEEFKEAAQEYNSIASFLTHIKQVGEELSKSNNKLEREDAIIVSTIHGVKGMEFKNVFIINCVEEILPHKNSIPQNMEEERRLFYVSITRAINNLFFYIPRQLRGVTMKCSRFIKESGLNNEDTLSQLYKTGEEVTHISFGTGRVIKLESNVIEIKFENNVSRKFDVNIIHNNGILKKL